MKTAAEITEEAAQKVCEDNGIKREHDREPWIEALAWEMGEGFDYTPALEALVAAAIEADRAQRAEQPEPPFYVGQRVTLTGKSWEEWGMRGQTVTINDVFGEGNAGFTAEDGRPFEIWQDGDDDYSAANA